MGIVLSDMSDQKFRCAHCRDMGPHIRWPTVRGFPILCQSCAFKYFKEKDAAISRGDKGKDEAPNATVGENPTRIIKE
jgi:hypothetical protein